MSDSLLGQVSGWSGPQERRAQAIALKPLKCPSRKKAQLLSGAGAAWLLRGNMLSTEAARTTHSCPTFPLHQFASPGGSQYWVSGVLEEGILSPQGAWHGGPPLAFITLLGSTDNRVRHA